MNENPESLLSPTGNPRKMRGVGIAEAIFRPTNPADPELSREEWLAFRTGLKNQFCLGGSDIASVLGHNPYRSGYTLAAEMLGKVKGGAADSEAMVAGRILEDAVAREFADRMDLPISKSHAILQHPEHKWLTASLDRVVGKSRSEVLEVKTSLGYASNLLWFDTETPNIYEYRDQVKYLDLKVGNQRLPGIPKIPELYYCQTQHYLACTGAQQAYVAALTSGPHFVFFQVGRDNTLIDQIFSKGEQYVALLKEGKLPSIDGSESTRQTIIEMAGEARPDTVTAPTMEDIELVTRWRYLEGQAKIIEDQINVSKNKIMFRIGSAQKLGTLVGTSRFEKDSVSLKDITENHPDIHNALVKKGLIKTSNVVTMRATKDADALLLTPDERAAYEASREKKKKPNKSAASADPRADQSQGPVMDDAPIGDHSIN